MLTRSFRCALWPALCALPSLALGAAALAAQQAGAPRPPFPLGEALEYRLHVAVGGTIGRGRMRVDGPIVERGVVTWRLVFEMQARRGPISATDRTVSWIDPVRFATTRFEKNERHPLSRSEEQVRIDARAGTWQDGDAAPRPLGHPEPLDELSFMYYLRTIPLDRDTVFEVSRHFDPARNPTTIKVLGEELVETPVGIFRTRIVEMHVKDPKRYRGVGVIRLNIDVADCHVPVRIVSRMPLLGTTTLLLAGWVAPPRYPGAMSCND